MDEDLIQSFFGDLSNLVIRDETAINTNMEKYYDITNILNEEGYNTNRLMRDV